MENGPFISFIFIDVLPIKIAIFHLSYVSLPEGIRNILVMAYM